MRKIPLTRLQEKFVLLINRYLEEKNINQKELASFLDIPEPNFSNLMTKNAKGEFKRPLTIYYLHPFLVEGIFTVEQIYDGKPESEREESFWSFHEFLDRDFSCYLRKAFQEGGITKKEMIAWIEGRLAAKKNSS